MAQSVEWRPVQPGPLEEIFQQYREQLPLTLALLAPVLGVDREPDTCRTPVPEAYPGRTERWEEWEGWDD